MIPALLLVIAGMLLIILAPAPIGGIVAGLAFTIAVHVAYQSGRSSRR